ncbi:MAG: hypothetical protein IJJ86_05005 [Clostridia bacterium]|nr:hypothetical protein [Clostridia bacterium]
MNEPVIGPEPKLRSFLLTAYRVCITIDRKDDAFCTDPHLFFEGAAYESQCTFDPPHRRDRFDGVHDRFPVLAELFLLS